MSDLDPWLESRFATAFESVRTPTARRTVTRARGSLLTRAASVAAAALVLLAAVIGGRGLGDLRSRLAPGSVDVPPAAGQDYRPGNCATTAATTWVFQRPAFDGHAVPIIVSGHLASVPRRNLLVGDEWFVSLPPTPSIELRVIRLDRPAPELRLRAVGYALARGIPPDFDVGWDYRTSVDAVDLLPTPAGCWRVELVGGGPDDALIYELRGTAPPGPGRLAP
jgi:hypothetical protein